MRDPLNWSLSLGRWWGLNVRIHGSFLVFVAATLYLSWPPVGAGAVGGLFPATMTGFLVLLGSVLWHELGHLWVARRNHLASEQIVLGPLGGLTDWSRASNAAVAWRLSLAGLIANLSLMVTGVAILWLTDRRPDLVHLLHPFSPTWVMAGPTDGEQVLRIGIWVNGLLVLLNLLPAYPFDGGRFLTACMLWWRPRMSRRLIAETVFWAAILAAALLLVIALVLWKHSTDALFPTWFALVLLAVVLLVSARRDILQDAAAEGVARRPGTRPDVDLPRRSMATTGCARAGTSDWSEDVPGQHTVWPARSEAEEEQQLDEVLERLHLGGMDSLDDRDRELLRRASARYRARRPERQ